jgi:mannose-6-phosphate isomerase-like protein (cupin superfamily)
MKDIGILSGILAVVGLVAAGTVEVTDLSAAHKTSLRSAGHASHEELDWYLRSLSGFDVGTELLVFGAGDKDNQQPHENDEVYHIVGGYAALTVADDVRPVFPGALVEVEAGVPHYFHDIEEKLVVLVFANHGHH